MTDAFGYAEAMLKQGKPYGVAASASGLTEADLRARHPGYGREADEDKSLPSAMSAAANLDPADLRRLTAVCLRMIVDRDGIKDARSMVLNIFNAIPAAVPPAPRQAVWEIVDAVATKHCLTRVQILSTNRQRSISHPRHEAMYELRKRTNMSLAQIGRVFGGMDHTSIVHGIRAHTARMADRVEGVG